MKRESATRFGDGAYLAASLALAAALVVMATLLAVMTPRIFSLRGAHSGLSAENVKMLSGLSGDVSCTVILPRNHVIYPKLHQMLFDFRDAVAPGVSLSLEFLDPHSDLARAADAARRYGATGWCVVFDNGRRFETVPYGDLVETAADAGGSVPSRVRPAIRRFRGEQVCVTALAKLAQPGTPVIYTFSGHGERDFSSYDQLTGYSDFARELAREGYELRVLDSDRTEIPTNCAVLIIAGPRSAPGLPVESAIGDYLSRGGGLLFLADRSESVPNGWEGLLSRLGLSFANLTAIADDPFRSGVYSILSDKFGDHPIVRNLERSAVCFVSPQVIDPAAPSSSGEPLPSVTAVVSAPTRAWGESRPEQLPRHFDEGVDRRGQLPLALAVEGPGGDGLGIRPFRAVAIGDSNFAANSLLEGGTTANRDFLLNAVAWLAGRDWATAHSAANEGGALRLAISRNSQIRLWLRSVLAWPLATLAFGAVMSAVRRLTR